MKLPNKKDCDYNPIYCKDCNNWDVFYKECSKIDMDESINPNIPIDFCEEYDERTSCKISDNNIIRYLENSSIPIEVKDRCIEAIKSTRYSKVQSFYGNYYCECGCPVEYFVSPKTYEVVGKQIYCTDCGAKQNWDYVKINPKENEE